MQSFFKRWSRVFVTFSFGYFLITVCSFSYLFFRTPFYFVFIFAVIFIGAYSLPFFLKLFSVTKIYDGKFRTKILKFCFDHSIDIQDVYVLKNDKSNAFISGFGNTKSVTFYSGLLECHPYDEIEAALAHELGHHKNNDSIFLSSVIVSLLSFGSLVSVNIYINYFHNFIFLFIICALTSIFLLPLGLFISRIRENSADLYAKKVLKDPTAFARFFERMLNREKESGNEITPTTNIFYLMWLTHPSVFGRIKLMK